MLHWRHTSRALASSTGRTLRSSRPLRLSILCLLLLSFAPLGFGVIASLPPTRFGGSFQIFSELWAHLMASVPWYSGHSRPAEIAAASSRTWVPVFVPPGGDRGILWFGDRLKITFFESLDISLDAGKAGADQVVATVFPRMDLSGEYAVDEGGNVNLPRLGAFPTTGQTIASLQGMLAAAFHRVLGRTSDVHVEIVERQPIYVLGTVRNAGQFKHTPGMSVLQALADAGGRNLATADTSKAIENIRETERLHHEEAQLDGLLLKQAILLSERNNLDTIVVPPSIKSRLSQAAPDDRLNALAAGAAATLGIERKRYEQQRSLAERQVGIARFEREAQNLRADQLKDLLAKKQAKLHEMEGIAAHGSVSQFKITDMSVEVSELLTRQEDLRVSVARAERGVLEAEAVLAKLETDRSIELEKVIATGQRDIDDCRRSIASMRAVIKVLSDGLPSLTDGSPGTLNLTITRRVPAGQTVIQADETTSLLPGDVLEVNSSSRSNPTASSDVLNEKSLQN
jgi:exopolysaccharide production protein ExoF